MTHAPRRTRRPAGIFSSGGALLFALALACAAPDDTATVDPTGHAPSGNGDPSAAGSEPSPGTTPAPVATPVPDTTPAPTPAPGATPAPTPVAASAARVWGVTIDDPWNTGPTVDALAKLPVRPMARIVFDEGERAADYVDMAQRIHVVADTMGEILDSFYVRTLTVSGYVDRTREYLDALGDRIDLWEIGNEINGEWLGTNADVVAKMRGAYDLVKGRGKATALTLYYNQDCWSRRENEMFTWAAANVPADMKAGLDYVLVSYYEDDCNGLQPDWNGVFQRLATMFPNAKLGIGECGTLFADRKLEYLNRYYTLKVDAPRYVGGNFWWYFSEDMVPASTPLWSALDRLMRSE